MSRKQQKCAFYHSSKGCKRASNCRFSHITETIQVPQITEVIQSKPKWILRHIPKSTELSSILHFTFFLLRDFLPRDMILIVLSFYTIFLKPPTLFPITVYVRSPKKWNSLPSPFINSEQIFPEIAKAGCITIGKNGTYYICTPTKILVFSKEGDFLSSFAEELESEALTKVAIDYDLNIYVLDEFVVNSVHIFSPQHEFLLSFQLRQSARPTAIAFLTSNTIIVADAMHHISKFSPSGELLSRIPENRHNGDYLTSPLALAVDNDDNIIVCDYSRIQIFNSQFKLLKSWRMGPSFRSVCVDMKGNMYLAEREGVIALNQKGDVIGRHPFPRKDPSLTGTSVIGVTVNYQGQLVICRRDAPIIFLG